MEQAPTCKDAARYNKIRPPPLQINKAMYTQKNAHACLQPRVHACAVGQAGGAVVVEFQHLARASASALATAVWTSCGQKDALKFLSPMRGSLGGACMEGAGAWRAPAPFSLQLALAMLVWTQVETEGSLLLPWRKAWHSALAGARGGPGHERTVRWAPHMHVPSIHSPALRQSFGRSMHGEGRLLQGQGLPCWLPVTEPSQARLIWRGRWPRQSQWRCWPAQGGVNGVNATRTEHSFQAQISRAPQGLPASTRASKPEGTSLPSRFCTALVPGARGHIPTNLVGDCGALAASRLGRSGGKRLQRHAREPQQGVQWRRGTPASTDGPLSPAGCAPHKSLPAGVSHGLGMDTLTHPVLSPPARLCDSSCFPCPPATPEVRPPGTGLMAHAGNGLGGPLGSGSAFGGAGTAGVAAYNPSDIRHGLNHCCGNGLRGKRGGTWSGMHRPGRAGALGGRPAGLQGIYAGGLGSVAAKQGHGQRV